MATATIEGTGSSFVKARKNALNNMASLVQQYYGGEDDGSYRTQLSVKIIEERYDACIYDARINEVSSYMCYLDIEYKKANSGDYYD